MGYFQVRYDSRVVIYDRRGFIRLATGLFSFFSQHNDKYNTKFDFKWKSLYGVLEIRTRERNSRQA